VAYIPYFYVVATTLDYPYANQKWEVARWKGFNSYAVLVSGIFSTSRVYFEVYVWDGSDEASGYSSNIYLHTYYGDRSLLVTSFKK